MSLKYPIPDNPKDHRPAPYHTAPVHRLRIHRDRDRKEGKREANNEPGKREYIRDKAKASKVPRTELERHMLQTAVDDDGDRDEVGAEEGRRDQRDDCVEGNGRAYVDEAQEHGDDAG